MDKWMTMRHLSVFLVVCEENSMFNTSVTGNPFTITFETLDGTVVEGVWNTTAKRIEF